VVSRKIPILSGMRDFDPAAHGRIFDAAKTVSTCFASAGYDMIDTPLLEETELFVRKSGGELTSRLYSFTDPGGNRVSLRPEFTSSVIRFFVQQQASLSVPARLQYSGPVFRYEPGAGEGFRQFTQVGVELVGPGGVDADAEIISLAWEGLDRAGLERRLVRIGHLGVLRNVLDSHDLSEPASQFIISNIQVLKSGGEGIPDLMAKAERVGLLGASLGRTGDAEADDGDQHASQTLIEDVLRESMPAPVGRRTTEQIVARLLRKLHETDAPRNFEDALQLAAQLVRIDGPPAEVVDKARRMSAQRGVKTDAFDELGSLVGLLETGGVPQAQVVLDLGLARGLGYYTGVIFEMVHHWDGRDASLGGGGRYDELVRALGGGADTPAMGFAYNLDQVVESAHSGQGG